MSHFMRIMSLLVHIFLLILVVAAAQVTRYNGYKLYEVIPQHEDHLQFLASLKHAEKYDFWTDAGKPGHPVNIMVSPIEATRFLNLLSANKLPYSLQINDIEKVFENERRAQINLPRTPSGKITFLQYNRYSAIQEYLQELAEAYPQRVEVETIGQSTEGRNIDVIRITNGDNRIKPIIFSEGGMHAREWIGPAQALYIIQQLVENETYRNLTEEVDWHIIPVLNPDGYEFTHTNTRLWRKTRSRGSYCFGADGNRNFDFYWSGNGTSSDECSNIYHGSSPFSEPETLAFSQYALRYSSLIKLYLSIHSCGQYIIYPWGYTSALPDDYDTLYSLASRVNAAISSINGTTYGIGTSTNTLGYAAGCSDDWIKGVAGISLSYCIELPCGGSFGFDLPTARILPVVREVWQGVLEYHSYVVENFVKKDKYT